MVLNESKSESQDLAIGDVLDLHRYVERDTLPTPLPWENRDAKQDKF
jgi:hypothetical protein